MHPIVAQMQPNTEQQLAILARDQDVVVTAGAGTGKTRTLVARYLSLLAEGWPLRSIVAITFTQKAAQEMRNRIRTEIRRFLNQSGLSLEEREHWDALYNELDAGRIGTIHSLCTEILRAHPAEAGVDPRFDVLDEGQAGILLVEAIDEALAWAADNPDAVTLFALLGEWRLRATLERLMGQRLDAQEAFSEMPRGVWGSWRQRLLLSIQDFIDNGQVRSAFAELRVLRVAGTLDRADALGDALAPLLRQLLAQWDDIVAAANAEDWAAVLTGLKPLRDSMRLKGSKKAWEPADPKAIIKELQRYYDDTLGKWVGDGINLELDYQLATAQPTLRLLFERAIGSYSRRKGERQVLDFDDLEEKALNILRHNASVRERWQEEVKAILVDEYQDTNGRQRDLLHLLNGDFGRSFIVGDAKQSIYRFRGADVTVFRAERDRIQGDGGLAFTLATSYRAHQDLVAGLNDLLRPILGEDEDPSRPWREPFSALEYFRQDPQHELTEPFITLQLTVGSKSDGALHRAAAALAEMIIDMVERQDTGWRYGDFAILCRASTSFAPYEDAFNDYSLPYLTVAGRGFFKRPEIRDLLNALQAVADPTNDLALVGFLRSPVIGFSDLTLYQLRQAWLQADQKSSLWNFLQASLAEIDPRAVELIHKLHQLSGRIPVATLLKKLLDETDYQAALLQAGYSRAARNVGKLLQDAHSSGIVHVDEFLEYVTQLQAGGAREGEARATTGDVIRIMSVHAAKGLEFPITIIGDVGYDRNTNTGLLLDLELGALPPLKDAEDRLPGLYRLLANQESDREAAETERLLYVAATRAQDMLILNGCIRLTDSGKPGWLRGWLKLAADPLNLGSQIIDYNPEGDRVIAIDLAVARTPVACSIYEPNYTANPQRLPEESVEAPPQEWTDRLLEEIPAGKQQVDEEIKHFQRDPPRKVWRVIPEKDKADLPPWLVGKLVHDALAIWRFTKPGLDDWLRSRAREYGLVDAAQLDQAVREGVRLLAGFRAHALFREMDSAGRRLQEVPYSLIKDDGMLDQGFIDALYWRNDQWSLVEFKSDRLKRGEYIREFLVDEGYLAQIKRYAAAVAQTIGQQPRLIVCLLDYGGEVRAYLPDSDSFLW